MLQDEFGNECALVRANVNQPVVFLVVLVNGGENLIGVTSKLCQVRSREDVMEKVYFTAVLLRCWLVIQ